jgi:ABC-type multidrug transport system fused ATPase/permease subunit
MRTEFIEKLAALITAAFGLVAALAWNGAIQAIFKAVFGSSDELVAMIVYAVIVTIIAVLVTLWVARAANRAKGGGQKQ